MNPPSKEQPTQIYVRNMLGIPENYDKIFDTLSDMQRVGLTIMRLSEDFEQHVDLIMAHGCEKGQNDRRRIDRLERWVTWGFGVIAGISAIGATVLFVLSIINFLAGAKTP